MSHPAPDEVRRVLAELLGWYVKPVSGGGWIVRRPGDKLAIGVRDLAGVPDPAADLNAMAAVEAEIHRQGRWGKYLGRLNAILHGWGWTSQVDPSQLGSRELWGLVTAPAAVRALAAYRVLAAAKDEG